MSWFRRGSRRTPPLRIALLGAGGEAGIHGLAARAAGDRVVAVASSDPVLAAARAGETGGEPMDVEDLLARADDLADVVIVTAPVAARAALVRRLLDASAAPHTGTVGMPIVLVEPPLCATLAEADALVEIAERAAGRLRYGEHLLHAPVVTALLDGVAEIGSLTHLEVVALGAGHGDHGHPLVDLGPRAVALALAAAERLALGEPADVTARADGPAGARIDLSFVSGAVASIQVGHRGDAARMWHLQVAGTTGVIRAELLPSPSLDALGTAAATSAPRGADDTVVALGYRGQLDALRPGAPAGAGRAADALVGRRVVEIVSAACRSLGREGTPTPLPYAGPRGVEPHALVRGG